MLCTRVLAQQGEELVGPQKSHRESKMVLSIQKIGSVRMLKVGNFETFHTRFEPHPVLEEMPDLAESRLLGASPV
jgi:hypothetical protein